MSEITRPVLRWHGGKWRLAPAILAHFPPHRVYTEPFGGAASVLLRKPRTYGEVYNDLDGEVVGLFRVLQNPSSAARLLELLRLTPFAHAEFDLSYEPADDPIEAARRLIIRSCMGFGSNSHATLGNGRSQTGFRANSNRSGTTPAQDWMNYPAALEAIIARWRGVVVEKKDAIKLMHQHDGLQTLHYVDPPYLPETRSIKNPHCKKHMYRHELSRGGHIKLLGALKKLAGMVVLSGYASELYDKRLNGWGRIELPAYADGARARTEVLWLNPACVAALEKERAGFGTPLFPYLEAAE